MEWNGMEWKCNAECAECVPQNFRVRQRWWSVGGDKTDNKNYEVFRE